MLEDAVTVRVWNSFVAPELIPERLTVCCPAFCWMTTLARLSRVGAWFTGCTLTVKVRLTMLLLAPPSLTVTVIVEEPEAKGTGVKRIEPVAFGLV